MSEEKLTEQELEELEASLSDDNEESKPQVVMTIHAELYDDGNYGLQAFSPEGVEFSKANVWALIQAIQVELMERTSTLQTPLLRELLDRVSNIESFLNSVLVTEE